MPFFYIPIVLSRLSHNLFLNKPQHSTDWLLCKITDYNVQSGEHLVCPIDDKGIIAGDAVWMVLASQRTKPRIEPENLENATLNATVETPTENDAAAAKENEEEIQHEADVHVSSSD